MLAGNPGREWERWGEKNSYFAVLTEPKFLDANLNDESLQDFFESGERHVEHVYSMIRAKVRNDFEPVRVLDYGCGVGRLVVPFARRAREVVGVDISRGMLEESRENLKRLGIESARALHVDELDSLAPASFDLIHSYIVFQHIPVVQGEAILRKLISLLAEGGVGAIQLTCVDTRSALRRGMSVVRRVGLAHRLMNLAQGKKFSTPHIQMNSYSMNRILSLLIEMQCSNLHVEFWGHQDFLGAMLYFERRARPLL
jgi:SAM-dependent methyltransferase